jgi:adenylate cyclase
MTHPLTQALFDWLVDGAPGATTPMAVLQRFGDDLIQAGIPIDRGSALVRTLHPSIMGRRFVFEPGKPVTVSEASWAILNSPQFLDSPVAKIFKENTELRVRLDGATGFADLDGLGKQGFTDWLGLPLRFMSGNVNALSLATRRKGGFSDEDLRALRFVTRALARVAETLALMRTSANLLNAYVGRDAGERIMKGQVQRGDTELIRCVIWFSDLRGFTSLSGTREPRDIISVLNEFFDCQVPALEAQGGEVLKFIGDGLLAIFPLGGRAPAEVAPKAVAATAAAFAALDKLNGVRAARGDGPLEFGVALHLGEVAYGNIGGAARLDFTAIGPAVNLASRLEGLTGKLGKRVVFSEAFVAEGLVPSKVVGTFDLKGVAVPQAVHEPAANLP